MATKHCVFANCTIGSQYKQDGVTFIISIEPQVNKKKYLLWIHLSLRTDLTVEKIKNILMCVLNIL